MQIIIAPNAFKGSLTAEQVAAAIAGGLQQSRLGAQLILFPIADGGDDTASLLMRHFQGDFIAVSVHDPLGRIMDAALGWVKTKNIAVLALSDASGMRLLKKNELNPLHANTFGTGELMRTALARGAGKIIVGVGGSATVDGGTGLLKALGARFLNQHGNEIDDLPAGLTDLVSVDVSAMDRRILQTEIVVLCDVKNKLLGQEGAARVFGPQKGADENTVRLLEACLMRWNRITQEATGIDMASLKYGGAAGGVTAAMAAYLNAKLVNGIDYFLDETHFEGVLAQADLIITGEGRIDDQTLEGKGPYGVALRAEKKNIPVVVMAGQIPRHPSSQLDQIFPKLIAINPPQIPLDLAMETAGVHLKSAARHLGNELARQQLS